MYVHTGNMMMNEPSDFKNLRSIATFWTEDIKVNHSQYWLYFKKIPNLGLFSKLK